MGQSYLSVAPVEREIQLILICDSTLLELSVLGLVNLC